MNENPKFTKVRAGWYATEDGKWAVVSDGYEKSNSVGAESGMTVHGAWSYEGFVGGEWALVFDPRGNLREDSASGGSENLDWYPTKREAVEAYDHWSRVKS